MMETGDVNERGALHEDTTEGTAGATTGDTPGSDAVARLLAQSFETSIPDDVFARVRQALSEQVQLRREDGDDSDDLDAEFTDMLAGAFDEDDDLDDDAARPTARADGVLEDDDLDDGDLEDGLGDDCTSSRGR